MKAPDFIKCDDYQKLTVGTHLVKIDEKNGRNNLHVATVKLNNQNQKNIIVGGYMYFDRKPLLSYVDITHLQSKEQT